jgi:hypothetical protein
MLLPSAPTATPRTRAIPHAPSSSQSSPQATPTPPVALSRTMTARASPTMYCADTPPLFATVHSPSPAPVLSSALQSARASPLVLPVLASSLHADCEAGSLTTPISRAEGESKGNQHSKFNCDVPVSPTTPLTTSPTFRSAPTTPSIDPSPPRSSTLERSCPMHLAVRPHTVPSSCASSPADLTFSVDLYSFGQHPTDNRSSTHRGLHQPSECQQSECDHADSALITATPQPTGAETDPAWVQPTSEDSQWPNTPSFVLNGV